MKKQIIKGVFLSVLTFGLLTVIGCDKQEATAKDPSHKVVCSCFCGKETAHSEIQTYDQPTAGCSSLDGVACKRKYVGDSTLSDCKQKGVPAAP